MITHRILTWSCNISLYYIHICLIFVYMHIYAYVPTYSFIHIYIYNKHIYTHIHIHIYSHIQKSWILTDNFSIPINPLRTCSYLPPFYVRMCFPTVSILTLSNINTSIHLLNPIILLKLFHNNLADATRKKITKIFCEFFFHFISCLRLMGSYQLMLMRYLDSCLFFSQVVLLCLF